jgi:hypothetical protein
VVRLIPIFVVAAAVLAPHSGSAGTPLFADGFEVATPLAWSSWSGWIWQPAPGTRWQWQLNSGTPDTSFDVAMYDIDLFDVPEGTIRGLRPDRVVVCYFSAGSWEDWRPDAADFPESVKGNALDGWPGEKWLDIRDLATLGPIMEARLDLAAAKGCVGVEPDNVDGYTNATGFPLTAADQLAYNRFLATEAHERGLSIGLKNDLDQVLELLPDFDWALNEQCHEYSECHLLAPFVSAGKAVFGVEYELEPSAFCPAANAAGFSFQKKHWDLDAWRHDCLVD